MKTRKRKLFFILLGLTLIALSDCNTEKKQPKNETSMAGKSKYLPGTFGFDHELLKDTQDIILLSSDDRNSQILLSSDYQGRVMTSTLDGPEGYSMGWINHELIQSGEIQEHINAFGGEDRFWLGPEGGQFSLFFNPGVPFDFENWHTPEEIDTEPFDLVSTNNTSARFKKQMTLINYSGTEFNLLVNRNVKLLTRDDIKNLLGISCDKTIQFVGVETENIITNTGEFAWTKETGMLSIWILGMLNPSPGTTIIIPFNEGDESLLGRVVNDEYFGKVPAERLHIGNGVIYFKGDGNFRSKIGLTPMRAKPLAGSYDEERNLLTIVQFSLPKGSTDYVNSMWELQDNPFSGDAVNSYNDGPLEDGSQMGPFYELESSSPAANLAPGEKLVHYHRTLHFKGEEKDLEPLIKALLGVGIESIKSAF
jgi:hypothetical protein